VRVAVGEAGAANADVKQEVAVLASDADKWPWLAQRIHLLVRGGPLLIFVATTRAADHLAAR
jgi:superfamily II DNA/RNA helicase